MVTFEAWQVALGVVFSLFVMIIVITRFDLPKRTLNKLGLVVFLLMLVYVSTTTLNGLIYLFGCTL